MYLTSLTHRDELFDIAERWLNNDVHEEDARRLTEIFLFESAVSAPTVQDFMLRFMLRLHGDNLSVERVRYKDALRERLIDCMHRPTHRMERLAAQYRESPEEFFPGLPVEAILMFSPEHTLVGMSRTKRPQRLAEKASFRMADALAGKIRERAELFASERATATGVPLRRLISTPQQMRADFMAAERVVAAGFRDGETTLDREDLTINDVIGFKIIGNESHLAHAEELLAQEEGVTIVEREVHRGDYNATNLLVDIALPPAGTLIDKVRAVDWSVAASRGLDPEAVRVHFPQFVETGSRVVRTELILTTFSELVESEFGRSLHELRILRLRERQSYSGQIAQNARYLIEYLIAVAYAPTVHIDSLPITMWGRYLPETAASAIGQLFKMEAGQLLRHFLAL